MKIFTIGFTKTSAEAFFGRIKAAGVRRVIDVRLNNSSQLSGFAKAGDLPYFLSALCSVGYHHEPVLAPTAEMLGDYRQRGGSWDAYEQRFIGLMRERRIEERLSPDALDGSCLLCSEDKPHRCHRRLVAEYLRSAWSVGVEIAHL